MKGAIFTLEGDERSYTLLIDGGMLDHAEAVRVDDDYGRVRLADDPIVRLTLDQSEAEVLWLVLDATIGRHKREGEVVREEVERTRREGLDTRIPSREAYLEAKDELLNREIPLSEEERNEALAIVTVYERAHGIGEGPFKTEERSQ